MWGDGCGSEEQAEGPGMACGSLHTAPHTSLATYLLAGPTPSALKSGPHPIWTRKLTGQPQRKDWGGGGAGHGIRMMKVSGEEI